MKTSRSLVVLLTLAIACNCLTAGEHIDLAVIARIRQEVTENSQIMRYVHRLTDVHGPRLTGSPAFTAACEWSVGELKLLGLQNVHTEEWDFGHYGWVSDHSSVKVLAPYEATLEAAAIAWTPSTRGVARGKVVQISLPENPTSQNLDCYLESIKEKVKGKIVLAGAHSVLPVNFVPVAKRREESELRAMFDPESVVAEAAQKTAVGAPAPKSHQIEQRIEEFLLANGALVKVVDSARPHGQLRVLANRHYNTARAVPGVVLRNEDYGRISRLLAGGTEVEMQIEVANTVFPEGKRSLNVIAEIPGTRNAEQVVVMGAHIDSWHLGTGATDNAAGVAVMMEAARVLQKLSVKPLRTIRLALWGGEEQGLLGSKAYVKHHFGHLEEPRSEFMNLAAYLNLDMGTGRVRGATVFGPPEAADVLRRLLQPFAPLGVVGVSAIQERVHGGNDSTSFNWAGLPGINLLQDPIEYGTHTWHTNLDTYERVLEDDLKQCAIIVASTVYHLATRSEMLPRLVTR